MSLEASFASSEEIIVFSVDANGAVAKWIRGAERALGYTAAEIVVETGRPHVPRKRMLRSRAKSRHECGAFWIDARLADQ